MRISDEVFRQTGIHLDDLAQHEAFQHEVAYAKKADSLMRVQDATMVLQTCASQLREDAINPDLPKFDTCWNFLVRVTHQSLAVMSLLKKENLPDAAILNRGILERALMLEWLRNTDSFELFRQYTVAKGFRHKEMWIRYHPGQGKGVITDEERRTALKYEANLKRANWSRPEMKEVARELGVLKMYEGIYHYSSAYVHPMYGEGEAIFRAAVDKPFEDYTETKNIVFGQTVSSLAFLCLAATITMGNPTRLGFALLEGIRNEASGAPQSTFDEILAKAKDCSATDLVQPRRAQVGSPTKDPAEGSL